MIAGGLGLRIQRQQSSSGGKGGLCLCVVFVGIVLAFGAHVLADRDRNFLVVGEADPDRAMIVIDTQAGACGRKVLVEGVGEVISLAENIIEIVVIEVHVVAEFTPVEARGLGGDESADNDED